MSCTTQTISNGYIVASQNLYNVNDTVTYVCNSFYTLSGNAVATCLDTSGTWSTIPSCKFAALDNVWFWMTVGLASLLALVLLLILLIFIIRYCCCHRRKSRVSEFSESQDRYGDSCGPCCGLVDYKGCCSLNGCCGFYGCCGGFCGACRCCREFPGDGDGNSGRHNRNSNHNSMKPVKKKVSVRQTQTSPTPTDSTTMDEKKKIAKMGDVYIISNHVDSTQTAPISTKSTPRVHKSPTTTTQTPREQNESMSSEKNYKKKAKVLTAWMPHSHDVREINTSTK
ncbi:uncharacterized protein LOC127707718 isoform X1 [Mytilus californianus]|uniref:uncharacterized protein LOC127707718 isoform X1 n=1 Tax=Mytilus californianus TaxID=6549 RepID=UPI002247A198|nr:uncharacterized protein LOC127707718 isoform X1 [Mytilus californianus]